MAKARPTRRGAPARGRTSKRARMVDGRGEILAAATRAFADHGFSGATTAGIARIAGVTQPLVHHHFGSKQGLWDAVLADLFAELEGVLMTAVHDVEGLDRTTRLRRLLHALVDFVGRRPELSRLIRTESSAGGAAFDVLYETWLKKLVAFFRQELQAAVDDGTFRSVEPHFGYSLVVGACTQPFAEPATVRRAFGADMRAADVIARYADFAVDVLLRGLAAPR